MGVLMEKLEILNELKSLLVKEFGPRIDKVILFGSQMNGDAHEFSDYDILIILKDDYDWRYKNEILGVCYEIDLKYDIITDVTIISHKEMETLRGKQPFIQDAIEHGVIV